MTDVNGVTGQQGSAADDQGSSYASESYASESYATEQDQVYAGQGSPTSTGWPGNGQPASPSGARRLERKRSGRWAAGVCAGVAAYAGVDPTVIRLLFTVLTFFGGVGPIAYVLGWALMPEEGDTASIAERFIGSGS